VGEAAARQQRGQRPQAPYQVGAVGVQHHRDAPHASGEARP
jgi:hypothetical protein